MISKNFLSIIIIGLLSASIGACSGTGESSNNTGSTDPEPVTSDLIAPSKPTNLQTTTLLPTSIVLRWDACTDNMGIAGYHVYKNNVLMTSTQATTYTDASVISNTAYQYTIIAYDASGNENMSDSFTVTTPLVADTMAPTAPGNLRTTAISSNSISLAWNASTDNIAVIGYRIYRGTSLLVMTASLSYTNSSLTANTSYQYRVEAVDAAGNIASSSTLTVSTASLPDTTPPSTPANLRSTAISSNSVTLAWNASSDNVGVVGYNIYRGTTYLFTTTSLNYTATNLTASTSYTFRVDAIDLAGNTSTQNNIITVITSVGAGVGVTSLNWLPPLTNTDGSTLTNLSSYKIYYGLSPTQMTSSITITNTGLTSYVISNLMSNTTYYFTITSVNSRNIESSHSNVVSKLVQG